jgi:hypothetical protein
MINIGYSIASTEEDFKNLKQLSYAVFDDEVKELVDDLFYRSPKRDKNIYFMLMMKVKKGMLEFYA